MDRLMSTLMWKSIYIYEHAKITQHPNRTNTTLFSQMKSMVDISTQQDIAAKYPGCLLVAVKKAKIKSKCITNVFEETRDLWQSYPPRSQVNSKPAHRHWDELNLNDGAIQLAIVLNCPYSKLEMGLIYHAAGALVQIYREERLKITTSRS
jgi:hypothetical protein